MVGRCGAAVADLPPTKQTRQNGDAHAFPGRTRTRLPMFLCVKLALPGPERRRRQFLCDNGIHCTAHCTHPFAMLARPADVPTPYARSSDGPHFTVPPAVSAAAIRPY